MQHTLPSSRFSSFDAEGNPPLNVVIVYEDFDAGKQAKKTFDLLIQNLGTACHLTNQMWNFDVLSIDQLRDIALKDAAHADILIVSCQGTDLPYHVKTWIEAALVESSNLLALVGLIHEGQAAALPRSAARNYLAAVARRAKVEFFAQPGPFIPERKPDQPVAFPRNVEVIPPGLTPLAGAMQQPDRFPRWGINE